METLNYSRLRYRDFLPTIIKYAIIVCVVALLTLFVMARPPREFSCPATLGDGTQVVIHFIATDDTPLVRRNIRRAMHQLVPTFKSEGPAHLSLGLPHDIATFNAYVSRWSLQPVQLVRLEGVKISQGKTK